MLICFVSGDTCMSLFFVYDLSKQIKVYMLRGGGKEYYVFCKGFSIYCIR